MLKWKEKIEFKSKNINQYIMILPTTSVASESVNKKKKLQSLYNLLILFLGWEDKVIHAWTIHIELMSKDTHKLSMINNSWYNVYFWHFFNSYSSGEKTHPFLGYR